MLKFKIKHRVCRQAKIDFSVLKNSEWAYLVFSIGLKQVCNPN